MSVCVSWSPPPPPSLLLLLLLLLLMHAVRLCGGSCGVCCVYACSWGVQERAIVINRKLQEDKAVRVRGHLLSYRVVSYRHSRSRWVTRRRWAAGHFEHE